MQCDDAITEETFSELVCYIRDNAKDDRKIYLVADNAGFHKTDAVLK